MSDQLDGATRLYPIIGMPILYAESPRRLSRTFAARGHHGVCVPVEVAVEDLHDAMAGLGAMKNVDGILVTMPHKRTFATYCSTLSATARTLGVVSVARRSSDGSWHGDTLDGLAFVAAQKKHGAQIEGARALLLGAGSAGSAIAVALLDERLAELVVSDTDASSAKSLVDLASGVGAGTVSLGPPDPAGFDLVLNATPMGMKGNDPLPVNVNRLSSSMFVGDVIAGHGTTALIEAAQTKGCATASGTHMVEAVQDLMADFFLQR